MQTRRPTTCGLIFGAITTGRPLSNSTACSASEEETSSPEFACGTTVRSASLAECETISCSRPTTDRKLALGPAAAATCSRSGPRSATPVCLTRRSNPSCTLSERRVASRSAAVIISSTIAPDSPSPASGATSRVSLRTCRAARCASKRRARISPVTSAASPLGVPFSGSRILRMSLTMVIPRLRRHIVSRRAHG